MKTILLGIPREISRSLDNSLTVCGVAERTLGQLALCKCQLGFQAGLQTPAAGLQLTATLSAGALEELGPGSQVRPARDRGIPKDLCPLVLCACVCAVLDPGHADLVALYPSAAEMFMVGRCFTGTGTFTQKIQRTVLVPWDFM